jgi:hypothetical protein
MQLSLALSLILFKFKFKANQVFNKLSRALITFLTRAQGKVAEYAEVIEFGIIIPIGLDG